MSPGTSCEGSWEPLEALDISAGWRVTLNILSLGGGGVNAAGIMKPNYTEKIGGTPLLKYIKTRVEKL